MAQSGLFFDATVLPPAGPPQTSFFLPPPPAGFSPTDNEGTLGVEPAAVGPTLSHRGLRGVSTVVNARPEIALPVLTMGGGFPPDVLEITCDLPRPPFSSFSPEFVDNGIPFPAVIPRVGDEAPVAPPLTHCPSQIPKAPEPLLPSYLDGLVPPRAWSPPLSRRLPNSRPRSP